MTRFLCALFFYLFITCSAAMATAQTAWVELEDEILNSKGHTTEKHWIVLKAYPSYSECMRAVYASARNCKPSSSLFQCREDGFTYFHSDLHDPGDADYFNFYCYPDTVDPRKQ
jgi:hypothetical protein